MRVRAAGNDILLHLRCHILYIYILLVLHSNDII